MPRAGIWKTVLTHMSATIKEGFPANAAEYYDTDAY